MNGKTGGCRGGEKVVMNYFSKVEDGRTGCQITNQAERGEERGMGRSRGTNGERWKGRKV